MILFPLFCCFLCGTITFGLYVILVNLKECQQEVMGGIEYLDILILVCYKPEF